MKRLHFLICEDGDDYLLRFSRFLGSRFDFSQAHDLQAALAALPPLGFAGILLDLDFRCTPAPLLVDEQGQTSNHLSPTRHQQLAQAQGIYLLRALRQHGLATPAVLFADFDDPRQITYLETDLAPLRIIGSSVGLQEIAQILAEFCGCA